MTKVNPTTEIFEPDFPTHYDVIAYIPKDKWDNEAVFVEDQVSKFRPMWIPRTAIKDPQFLSKRVFGGKTHFVYNLEIKVEWWHQNVQFKGFEFETNNSHRKNF